MAATTKSRLPVLRTRRDVSERVASAILAFVSDIPKTREHRSSDPQAAARRVAAKAAAKAALTAGGLALPPGPLGWLTVLPELVAIWRIQAQMVADIAAVYGKKTQLSREQMIYCLFRHTAAQAVRDIVVRVGERFLVRRAPAGVFQGIAARIASSLIEQVFGKSVSRWVPFIGAIGVGAYAYYDTGQVAATAIEMFRREIEVEVEADGDVIEMR